MPINNYIFVKEKSMGEGRHMNVAYAKL